MVGVLSFAGTRRRFPKRAPEGRRSAGGKPPRRAYARTGWERARRQSLVSLWEGGLKTDRLLGVGSGAEALAPVQNEASESAAERPQLQFPVAGQLAQFGKVSAVAGDCIRRRSGTSWMRSRTAAERNPPARGNLGPARATARTRRSALFGGWPEVEGEGSTLVRHTEEGLGALNDPRRSPCSRNSRGPEAAEPMSSADVSRWRKRGLGVGPGGCTVYA